MRRKLFTPSWVLGSVLLFLYSYTQVDLSLTLSRASFLQTIQKSFQYVGWFNRPLSAFLYIILFLFLFLIYFWTLRLVQKNKIGHKQLWTVILIVTGIVVLSYNAFSYDLFNYIFDAKIVTFYNQNPYVHKALDFPGDPMLSFMRWTHRVYPYGPLWLALTVPVSFVGSQIFIITFFLFKLLMGGFFLLTVWSIGKIATKLKLSNVLLPIAAFALNPFVLAESLVSAHNDIVMMGLGMLGVYFLLKRDYIEGGVLLIFSAGVKFVTLVSAILYIILSLFKKQSYFIAGSIVLMIIGVILASYRTNFQPWYLLYVFPFAALMIEKKFIRGPLFIFSIGNILYYIPYLYTGNWDAPIPAILNSLVMGAVVLSILLSLFYYVLRGKS